MFDWLYLLQAAFLGIVEGLTEFLPVSSTGHLIVAADLVGFTDATSDTFVVAIQAGAILAVCWYYRMRIIRVLRGLFSEPVQQRLVVNTLVASLPAAVVGVLVSDLLKTYLFNPLTVATALVIGGLIILYVEHRHEKLGIEPRVKEMDDMDWKDALKVGVAQCLAMIPGTSRSGATIIGGLIILYVEHRHEKLGIEPRVKEMDDMDWKDALKVGVAQCLAMIPGTSRSGATIIGGLIFGLSRKAATEFSFFLAIPTIFGATVWDLWQAREQLVAANLPGLAVGTVVSFFSALVVVHWLIRFVSRHDFRGFGWYRIIFGGVILLTWATGLVSW